MEPNWCRSRGTTDSFAPLHAVRSLVLDKFLEEPASLSISLSFSPGRWAKGHSPGSKRWVQKASPGLPIHTHGSWVCPPSPWPAQHRRSLLPQGMPHRRQHYYEPSPVTTWGQQQREDNSESWPNLEEPGVPPPFPRTGGSTPATDLRSESRPWCPRPALLTLVVL